MLVPSLPTPRVLMLKVIPYGFTWEWRRSPPGLTHTEIRQIQSQKIYGRRNHDPLRAFDQLDRGRAKTIKERPERIREVNQEIEAMGVTVIAQYAILGLYDFVNIVEAPDTGAITRLSMELGSRGTLQVMSMPAMPLDDFIAIIKGS